MEFKFKLTDYIKRNTTKIDNTLIPEGFKGDRRTLSICVQTISEVIDRMGIASAKAQGLQKAITSADKLRNSDHSVYLLIDYDENRGSGSIIGFLKMGRKKLYVFDQEGHCHYNYCLCVLDFYVHESRQRQGCGKQLFEYMLDEEDVTPEKLAIDRPSDKFISFLKRHYNLDHAVPQNNNFVVFQGFFSKKHSSLQQPINNSQRNQNSITYNGRHAAHKPETTIGKCLTWYTAVRPKIIQGDNKIFGRCTQASAAKQHNTETVFTPVMTTIFP